MDDLTFNAGTHGLLILLTVAVGLAVASKALHALLTRRWRIKERSMILGLIAIGLAPIGYAAYMYSDATPDSIAAASACVKSELQYQFKPINNLMLGAAARFCDEKEKDTASAAAQREALNAPSPTE